MNNKDFLNDYRKLEARMRRLAEKNSGIYIPNVEPRGPVDYLFICMEPSLGGWVRIPFKLAARYDRTWPPVPDQIGHRL